MEWRAAGDQLALQIPLADEVFQHWFRMLNEFENDIPQLHKLASEAMKVSLFN